MIYIPEIIGRVVDSMREYGDYVNYTTQLTTHTIISPNTLKEGEWILIFDNGTQLYGFEYTFPVIFTDSLPSLIAASGDVFGQFQVKNVTENSFDIVSSTAPPETGSWKSLEPFYIFGHRLEISNRLLEKDKDKIFKFQKYPLFALRLDISESVTFGNVHEVDLNIAILEYTNKNYTAQQRYDNVIHPTLMPLYFEFMKKIQDSSEFMQVGFPEHTKIDRPFYGIEGLEGNQSYIFNDPLDCVEIIDLNLKIQDKNCN